MLMSMQKVTAEGDECATQLTQAILLYKLNQTKEQKEQKKVERKPI